MMSWSGNNRHEPYQPRSRVEPRENGWKNSRKENDPERYHEKKQRQLKADRARRNRPHREGQETKVKQRNICNNCYQPDCSHRSRNMTHCSILTERLSTGGDNE